MHLSWLTFATNLAAIEPKVYNFYVSTSRSSSDSTPYIFINGTNALASVVLDKYFRNPSTSLFLFLSPLSFSLLFFHFYVI